jgi:hypothetical protein
MNLQTATQLPSSHLTLEVVHLGRNCSSEQGSEPSSLPAYCDRTVTRWFSLSPT